MAEDDDSSPGWDAITGAFEGLYGDQEPLHFGTVVKWMLGGPDPLDGLSAYRAEDPLHWHIVSYGMTELYRKSSDDPEVSGWGFEFTMRVAREAGDAQPPMWALSFLQNIGRYVFRSGNWFEPGHHMSLNGPIALGEDTAITCIAFREDPSLGTIDTPHGRVQFLQVLGVTEDERDAAVGWNTDGLLELLAERDPKGVIDLGRRSILEDPAVQARVEEGTRTEGSSCGVLLVGQLGWDAETQTLSMGALQTSQVARLLRGRLGFDRPLMLQGQSAIVGLKAAETCHARREGQVDELGLSPAAVEELASVLRPVAGRVVLEHFPGLTVEIRKTEITDASGKVVEVVG